MNIVYDIISETESWNDFYCKLLMLKEEQAKHLKLGKTKHFIQLICIGAMSGTRYNFSCIILDILNLFKNNEGGFRFEDINLLSLAQW